MNRFRVLVPSLLVPTLLAGGAAPRLARGEGGTISVLTTTTDLGEIVKWVGAERVSVKTLCKGPEDPHFLEARPSFIRMGGEADLLVIVGMELEVGYLPLILRDGSNPRIKPGSP